MDRRVKKTKQAIRQAFLELIKDTPINKIHVSTLTEMADINRKTFYLHYVDIYAVEEEFLNEFISRAKDLQQYLNFPSILQETDNFVEVLFDKLLLTSFEYKDVIHTDFFQRLLRKVVEYLGESIKQDYIRNGGTQLRKLSYVFNFFSGGIVNIFIEWVQTESESDQELIKELLVGFLDYDYISQIDL